MKTPENPFSARFSAEEMQRKLEKLSPEQKALLEKRLRRKRLAGTPPDPIRPRSGVGPVPASFGQRRLWFLHQLEHGHPVYNIHRIFRIEGPLDHSAFQHTYTALIARHDALRTTFFQRDGELMQQVNSPSPAIIPEIDLRNYPDDEKQAELDRLLLKETRHPFDLASGPLLRVKLFRISSEETVFLLVIHHIALDEWSMSIFLQEFSTIYNAAHENRNASLPDLPIQYSDYALWQRNQVESVAWQQQLMYWKKHIGTHPPFLSLPLDYSRPGQQLYDGARYFFRLPAGLVQLLEALCRREDVTLFMILLAAFNALLHRYSGQDDILVGAPISNRNRSELEPLIGFFVNTLVLRTDLSGNPSFRELLARIREVSLQGFIHSEFPFEKLVEELQPERDLGRNPLFQVMLVMQNVHDFTLNLTGLKITPLPFDRGTAMFDLVLFLEKDENELTGRIEYNTSLFREDTIVRMETHFRRILESVVKNPDINLGAIPLLGEEEIHLLSTWNKTGQEVPLHLCVHQLVEAQVARTPDATALESASGCLTYRQLNHQADRVAQRLREKSVGPETVVGILLERSLEYVAGALGVLKADGAYLPLDPELPDELLEHVLEESGVQIILSQPSLSSRISHLPVILVNTAEHHDMDTPFPPVAPDNNPQPDNLAYIIYTSGTTGRPKGVAMPHRPLVNLLSWQMNESGPQNGQKTLHVASLSFDVSFQEIFSTLAAGGTLVLPTEEQRKDPRFLLGFIQGNSINRLFLPVIMYHQLAEACRTSSNVPNCIREINVAGEQLRITSSVRWMMDHLENCRLQNQYGPTETHVVTGFTLSGPPEKWPDLPPIGRPIQNSRIYLLDKMMNPVPIGIPGELCIGGDALARGYVHQPELTAEKFIYHTIPGETPERLYRTGDLARFTPDGELVFLGRTDHQVKIRGFRVEPDGIEVVLRSFPSVREVVVLAEADVMGHAKLLAYIIPRSMEAFDAAECRRHLQRKLPAVMIPSDFKIIDSLPLTSSGKIDRKAISTLPAKVLALDISRDSPPRSSLEKKLVRIWAEVLEKPAVGLFDNFFDLGGHSLLAVHLFNRIEEELGLSLPISTLFTAPTVAELAEIYSHGTGSSPAAVLLSAGPPVTDRQILFCIHNVTGSVFTYSDLSSHLQSDLTVYAIQGQFQDGAFRHYADLDEMIAIHIREIRRIQPAGPYFLAGHSSGGLVAMEIAHHLLRDGLDVPCLILFDTIPPPGTSDERRSAAWELVGNFLMNIPYWIAAIAGEKQKKWAVLQRRLKHLVGGNKYSWINMFGKGHQDFVYHHLDLLHRHQFSPYPRHIILFSARAHGLFKSKRLHLDWRPWATKSLKVHQVPGFHDSLLKNPNVREVADKIKIFIQQAYSPSDGKHQ